MSKKTTPKGDVKKLEEQIKPILEKLTFDVLKNKPNNIVSNINFWYFWIASIYVWLFKKIMSLWFNRRRKKVNGRVRKRTWKI